MGHRKEKNFPWCHSRARASNWCGFCSSLKRVIACDSQMRLPLPLWTSSPILPIALFYNNNALIVLNGGADLRSSNVWLLIYFTGSGILSNVRSCYRNRGCTNPW